MTDKYRALMKAESFIAGFEGDELQEGIDELLQEIRDAIRGRSDQQIVDETNELARHLMAELVNTGYQVPDGWKFYEAVDPRSQSAWHHAVTIMEMLTHTDANDALMALDPEASKAMFPIEDWQSEVANGDTHLGYEEWRRAQHDG